MAMSANISNCYFYINFVLNILSYFIYIIIFFLQLRLMDIFTVIKLLLWRKKSEKRAKGSPVQYYYIYRYTIDKIKIIKGNQNSNMRKYLSKIKYSDLKKRKINADVLKLILQLQKASSKSLWPSSTIVPGSMGLLSPMLQPQISDN